MPTMKRSRSSRGAAFTQSPGRNTNIKVSAGKGGVRTGVPAHCAAKRHLFDKVARKGPRATQID